jgi:transposase
LLQAESIEKKEKTDVVQVETLDHLGIVAGLVDKLKLVERIDVRVLISKTQGAIVTHGQSIKAMIINGLGFTQSPIYLSPTFFECKDVCAVINAPHSAILPVPFIRSLISNSCCILTFQYLMRCNTNQYTRLQLAQVSC